MTLTRYKIIKADHQIDQEDRKLKRTSRMVSVQIDIVPVQNRTCGPELRRRIPLGQYYCTTLQVQNRQGCVGVENRIHPSLLLHPRSLPQPPSLSVTLPLPASPLSLPHLRARALSLSHTLSPPSAPQPSGALSMMRAASSARVEEKQKQSIVTSEYLEHVE